MTKLPCVYILASKRNGTLYIGVTSNLTARLWQHKNDVTKGVTERYQIRRLVYYETCDDMASAVTREKQLKKWNRAWKLRLLRRRIPRGETYRMRYGDCTSPRRTCQPREHYRVSVIPAKAEPRTPVPGTGFRQSMPE